MKEALTEKRCPKCGEVKPVSEFNKCRTNKDGLQGYCRSCQKAYYRTPRYRAHDKARKQTPKYRAHEKARRQTPEYKAYQKAYGQTPECKAYHRAYSAKFRFFNRDLCNARTAACAAKKQANKWYAAHPGEQMNIPPSLEETIEFFNTL